MKNIIGFIALSFSFTSLSSTFIGEAHHPLTSNQITQLLKSENVLAVEKLANVDSPYFSRAYRIDTKSNTLSERNLFKSIESVSELEFMSISLPAQTRFMTSDEHFAYQWGLMNQGQSTYQGIDNINTQRLIGKDGVDINWLAGSKLLKDKFKKSPVVAIIDSGIDYSHPELKDNLQKNASECDENGKTYSVSEKDPSFDSDKNGFSGDCIGWNFAAPYYIRDGKRVYDINQIRDVNDDHGHGTAIAGIIAAKNNETGITGVSDQIKILPIRVTGSIDLGNEKSRLISYSDRFANAIVYAVKSGADVINLSLGWPQGVHKKHLVAALDYAASKNIPIIAAAGNNSGQANIFPCSFRNVICVGSISLDGSLSSFTNYGGEVDVLAPGDSIIATYPTDELSFTPIHLNKVGYDVLSGTSFAAPFVSAMAAILKGIEPEISMSDVYRRIVDSAKAPHDPRKSIAGLVDLEKMLLIGKSPSVKPVFKSLYHMDYNFVNGNFNLPLFVKNYGSEAQNVKVIVQVESGQIALKVNQFTAPVMNSESIFRFNLYGRVLNISKDNEVKLKISVEAEGQETKVYYKKLELNRLLSFKLQNAQEEEYYKKLRADAAGAENFLINTRTKEIIDRNLSDFKFEFRAPETGQEHSWLPLGKISPEGVEASLLTVQTPFLEVGAPEYHIALKPKDEPLRVDVFRFTGQSFRQLKNSIILDYEDASLISLKKMDANYDGVDDYLIFFSGKEEGKVNLYFGYFNEKLEPLFADKSILKYEAKWFSGDVNDVRFMLKNSLRYMKKNIDGFGFMALPVMYSLGRLPKNAQDEDDFDSMIDNRIYYLKPILSNGSYEFETYSILTKKIIDDFKSKNGYSIAFDDFNVYSIMAQSLEEYNQGIVQILVSVGSGYNVKNYLGTIQDEKILLTHVQSFQTNFTNYLSYPVTEIGQNSVKFQAGDTFVRFMNSKRMKIYNSAEDENDPLVLRSKYRYDVKRSVDMPLDFIASYKKADTDYSLFQTKKELVILKKEVGSSAKVLRKRVQRFSFLPGLLLNEMLTPIIVRNGEELTPAIYTDSTQLNANQISLTTVLDDEIIKPISKSIRVPNNCKAMNPYPFFQKGAYSYALFCFEKTQNSKIIWSMKYLPLNN